jgi:hypothetical protein
MKGDADPEFFLSLSSLVSLPSLVDPFWRAGPRLGHGAEKSHYGFGCSG